MYCTVSLYKCITVYTVCQCMGDPLIITYNYNCLFGVGLQSQHILAYGVRHVEVSLYLSVQDYRLYSRRSWPGSEDWKNIFIFCRASFPSSHPVTHPIARFLYCPSLLVFASPLHISAVHVSRPNKIGTSGCRPSALPIMGVNEYRSGGRKA